MESSGEFHFICIRQECSLIIKRHKSRVDIYTHTQVERERRDIFRFRENKLVSTDVRREKRENLIMTV